MTEERPCFACVRFNGADMPSVRDCVRAALTERFGAPRDFMREDIVANELKRAE